MRTVNLAAFAGIGFLAIGAIFSLPDPTLPRTSFELMAGPIFWIVGCALMVAWAMGRVALAETHGSDISSKPPSALKEETSQKRRVKSEPATAASDKKAVAGHLVADFLAPLAIWLILLSLIATIVLLLGYGSA